MDEKEVVNLYIEIESMHKSNLDAFGVKMPKLRSKSGFTINSLVLIYLYSKVGEIVTKNELTQFLGKMGIISNDVQQARHLAQQSGWYILSGTRGDTECKRLGIKAGEYMLKNVKEPYPSYIFLKRSKQMSGLSWDDLKKEYNYRCATCGSKEGEPNFMYPSTITILQKGHKDPNQPLVFPNIIPQCNKCNQTSRNYFVFDSKGKVAAINDPQFIRHSSVETQIDCMRILIENYWEEAQRLVQQQKSSK